VDFQLLQNKNKQTNHDFKGKGVQEETFILILYWSKRNVLSTKSVFLIFNHWVLMENLN